jgi:hypothetical protein
MAPEETMMTLCPSRRSLIAVSTIKDKIDRIGSCVVSSTIEDVPITMVSFLVDALLKYGMVSTNFNDYRQMPAGFHGCGEYYGRCPTVSALETSLSFWQGTVQKKNEVEGRTPFIDRQQVRGVQSDSL